MLTEQNRDIDFNDSSQRNESPKDILIIDDAYDNLAVLDQLLADSGYEVRVARDGTAGLRAAHAQLPDLILLDVLLPQMDGYAVCAELKAADVLHDIPVIFISAVHNADDILKAFEAGGVDYITKPFRAQEVIARIKTHLELVQLRKRDKDLVLIKERQRMARELHDSVKQTLFMIGSTAESLQLHPDMSEDNRAYRLDQLRQLSQTAIAEMNMMLLELHPRKLIEVELPILLRQLAEFMTGRTLATITVIAESLICRLSPDVKVAFFRIAQEALTNAIRHADATHITVTMVETNHEVELVIEDDGVGFDSDTISATGLGLDNMRERAAAHGLRLAVDSKPDGGTYVKLVWSIENARQKNPHRTG